MGEGNESCGLAWGEGVDRWMGRVVSCAAVVCAVVVLERGLDGAAAVGTGGGEREKVVAAFDVVLAAAVRLPRSPPPAFA